MTENYFLVGYYDSGRVRLALQINQQYFRLTDDLADFDMLLQDYRAANLMSTLIGAKESPITLLPEQLRFPAYRQEVWAAGVTYKRSEEARELESDNSKLYTRVYSAERPEIFLKAMGWDVVNLQQPVGIRHDASWSVPEPELTVVLNTYMEVIGFTIGNDMSSRDIEGENPLYLPQAKLYDAACALGPRIWLQPGCTTWPELSIHLAIRRGADIVYEGETDTTRIHRPLLELIEYLGRCKSFTYGAFLMSGTGIVPPDDFTLAADDEVEIGIEPIGALVNRVIVIK